MFAGVARLATADERTRLWDRLAAELPRYAGDRSRSQPIVVVEPA